MIARVWRGATRAEDGDAYAAYIEETGMKGARASGRARHARPAARVAAATRSSRRSCSSTRSRDVKAFAGDELDAAVFFPEDDRYLIERDLEVRHFEADVKLV